MDHQKDDLDNQIVFCFYFWLCHNKWLVFDEK